MIFIKKFKYSSQITLTFVKLRNDTKRIITPNNSLKTPTAAARQIANINNPVTFPPPDEPLCELPPYPPSLSSQL